MRNSPRVVTRMSDKGQVILPKTLRERRGWTPGTEFFIEERPEGVFLRPAVAAGPATMDESFGSLRPAKEVVTIEDMQEAMLQEARRRWGEDEEASD
jgi:AbrB family looped-hinge helix DNA binding protein